MWLYPSPFPWTLFQPDTARPIPPPHVSSRALGRTHLAREVELAYMLGASCATASTLSNKNRFEWAMKILLWKWNETKKSQEGELSTCSIIYKFNLSNFALFRSRGHMSRIPLNRYLCALHWSRLRVNELYDQSQEGWKLLCALDWIRGSHVWLRICSIKAKWRWKIKKIFLNVLQE